MNEHEFGYRIKQHLDRSLDLEAATLIMLKIHHEGRGVCGVYTYEVAETKVAQVIDSAMRVEYRFVDELPVTGMGKFRLTVSKIARK